MVRLHHPAGIVGAGLGGEVEPVDHVAAVGRQRHAFAGLVVGRTGLGELAGHPAHFDHGQRGAVGEHHGHLQNGLDPGTDLVGSGCAEGLGTISALEQEGLAIGGLGQTFAQDVDFAGEDQRRQRIQLGYSGGVDRGVVPAGLLHHRQLAPVIQTGVVRRRGQLVGNGSSKGCIGHASIVDRGSARLHVQRSCSDDLPSHCGRISAGRPGPIPGLCRRPSDARPNSLAERRFRRLRHSRRPCPPGRWLKGWGGRRGGG